MTIDRVAAIVYVDPFRIVASRGYLWTGSASPAVSGRMAGE